MENTMKKRMTVIALLLAMVLLLAACSDSGKNNTADTKDNTAATGTDNGAVSADGNAVSTETAAVVTEVTAASVEGTWALVDITGGESGEDFASFMSQLRESGGSLTLTFRSGTMTVDIVAEGQSYSDSTTYEIKNGKMMSEGSTLDLAMDGDQLTLTEGQNSMVLKKQN